jgi:hypothetical protein
VWDRHCFFADVVGIDIYHDTQVEEYQSEHVCFDSLGRRLCIIVLVVNTTLLSIKIYQYKGRPWWYFMEKKENSNW